MGPQGSHLTIPLKRRLYCLTNTPAPKMCSAGICNSNLLALDQVPLLVGYASGKY